MLGKRKRSRVLVSRSLLVEESAEEGATGTAGQDLFRQYFETHFQPLPEVEREEDLPPAEAMNMETYNDSVSSEWSGLSENESDGDVVEIVEHQNLSHVPHKGYDIPEVRSFMVNGSRSRFYFPSAHSCNFRVRGLLTLARLSYMAILNRQH